MWRTLQRAAEDFNPRFQTHYVLFFYKTKDSAFPIVFSDQRVFEKNKRPEIGDERAYQVSTSRMLFTIRLLATNSWPL